MPFSSNAQRSKISGECDSYIETLFSLHSHPFPNERFPTLAEFYITVGKSFSRSALMSKVALERPLKAQYHDGFYRASYEVLEQ